MVDIMRQGTRIRIGRPCCCGWARTGNPEAPSAAGLQRGSGVAGEHGMAERRRHVFVDKVLKRLFPTTSSGQEKTTSQTPASEKPCKRVAPETVKSKPVQSLTDSDTKTQSERRLYTVSLPPEGYLPESHSCLDSENISTEEDVEDQDSHDQPKRRRIRKHKSKKNLKNSNFVHVEQAELEKHQSLLQEKLQHQHTDGPSISKNKKRKLKKKRQIKRKKAAGLATKASGVNFMYQPAESTSEQENERDSEGEVRDSSEEDVRDANEEEAGDASEEEVKVTNEKADGILSLLKSMQEIYFYDGLCKDSDSSVCVETTEELLRLLESRCMPASDVFVLDHMKTLLLLQDTERLKSALEIFPEHCMMPPGSKGLGMLIQLSLNTGRNCQKSSHLIWKKKK
ncbi:glutamate-rich protein 1 isoform X2 [Oryctolagus cuniculus]|uniref:glutamate-rich protein 1 isoform X2 n=1 Tax=Oryctolagus cuniculus TaxID=9986 RepID=UPI00387A7C01